MSDVCPVCRLGASRSIDYQRNWTTLFRMRTERTTAEKFRLGVATVLTGVAVSTGAPAFADTTNTGMAPQVSHAAASSKHNPNTAAFAEAHAKAQTQRDVQRMSKAALDVFTGQITAIVALNPAGDIDRLLGIRPSLDGQASLTDLQQQQLKDAAETFVKSLPVGVLPERLQQLARTAVKNSSQPDRQVETVRIGDLGNISGDVAKQVLKNLRTDHPTAFYALASAAATGAGLVLYSQGTAGLEKLGVSPQASVSINKHISVQAELHFGPHFKDPTGAIGATATTTVLNAQIQGKVMVDVNGPHRGRTSAELRVDHAPSGTSAIANLHANGGFEARLSNRTALGGSFSGLTLDQSVHWQQGVDTRFEATLSGQTSNGWSVAAGANYSVNSNAFGATMSATRTMSLSRKNDLSYGIRAGTDGNHYHIGVGAQLKF
jgi:hypothetical protein